MTIAVPLTHVLLAMIAAFFLPKGVKNATLEWEGYTQNVTRIELKDAVCVDLEHEGKATHYTFQGSKVSLWEMTDGMRGSKEKATGEYNLKEDFGIADPAALTGDDVVLTSKEKKDKSVMMHLEKTEHSIKVTEKEGDSPAVFGYTDKKFPEAKFQWK